MSKKSVFCIATSRNQADQIVDRLKTESFSNHDISVLFPDKGTARDFAHEKNTKAPEGVVAGAGTGSVIGGALGAGTALYALVTPKPKTTNAVRALPIASARGGGLIVAGEW